MIIFLVDMFALGAVAGSRESSASSIKARNPMAEPGQHR